MKNNKFIINIMLAVLLVFASSCEDGLEVNPQGSLTPEIVLSNAAITQGVLTGAYARMRDDDTFNGTPQLSQEWMSDNINFVGSFPTFQNIKNYETLADNNSIFAIWRDNYDIISSANFIINTLPNADVPDLADSERARTIAEAKFIRAITHFNLVNIFAQPFQVSNGANKGVPVITEFFNGDAEAFKVPRNTVNEVHAAIEKDLLEGIPDLLDVSSRGNATKGAARALLARLYLYREQFVDAANYADQVIQDNQFVLAPDYAFYNSDEAAEHIFQIINNAIDGQGGTGFTGLSNAAPGGRGDAPFSQNLLDAFASEVGDLRFSSLNTTGTDAAGGTSTFSTKFPEFVNRSDNAPIIRVTEMYLTRAEANLRATSSVGASPLADINKLRERANLPALGSVDLDAILIERRKELCFEGQRRMDLLRNRKSLRRAGQGKITNSAFGADKTIFPIPTSETDLNPNITQNTGY